MDWDFITEFLFGIFVIIMLGCTAILVVKFTSVVLTNGFCP